MLLNYLVYIACLALMLLRCVLLGLTVYYDARAKQLKDATKWAVIAALGGVLACLFYYFLVRRKSKPMLHCSVCGALVSPGESRCSRCNTAGKLKQEVAESSLFLRRSKTMLLSWLIATVMAALICLFFFVAWLSAQGGYIEESYEYVQEPPYEFSIEEATGVLIEEATTSGESVPSGTP